MSFPRYPAYKPSGVEWLGEVPEHWDILPLKRRSRLLTEKTECRDNPVALENIEGWTGRFVETDTEFQGEGIAFESGDILFGKLRPYLAKVYLAAISGQAVGDFHVIHPLGGLNSRFLQLALLTRELIDLVNGSTFGAKMPRASWDFLGSLPLCIPPLDEQHAIASFLDRETAKIDALIAEQQRLIELLQEKRQAVISHAVTKGLNPNAPMKDSGVEWLGEVPEHWEVKPLKHLTRQISVGVVVEPSKYYDDQGTVPALRSLNIKAGAIQMDDCVYVTEESNEILKKSRLCAGDLVVVRTGQPGTCAVIPDELDNCNCIDLIFIRKPRDGDSTYLMLSLSSDSSRYQYAAGAEGAIQQHFNVKTASELVVTWPPEEEQSQIRDWLMRKTSDVDRLTSIAVQSIELLEERRSALISAAVTGQIDVRGLVEEEAGQQ